MNRKFLVLGFEEGNCEPVYLDYCTTHNEVAFEFVKEWLEKINLDYKIEEVK